MIEIKLVFPSYEAAITALAAVRAADGKTDKAEAPKVEPAKPDAKPKKDAAETKPSAAPAPAAASPTPPAESKSPDTSSGVTREQVAAAIKAGAAANREGTVRALGAFGAKLGKDLKDEQLADFMAKLEEELKPGDDLAG